MKLTYDDITTILSALATERTKYIRESYTEDGEYAPREYAETKIEQIEQIITRLEQAEVIL